MVAHTASPMADSPSLRDVIVPMHGPTEASRQINLAIANAERRAIGLPPQERIESNIRPFSRVAMPIPPRLLPPAQTEALQDQVDALVEQYGYGAVRRAVQIIAAANGIEV
jgi:hypothetical protein